MPVSGFDHIGVVVRDLESAVAAWGDRFGLVASGREELPAVGVRVAYLGGAGTRLQLLEPTAPGPLRDFLDAHGEGVHHLCFAVDDIPTTIGGIAPGAAVRMHMGGGGRRASFLPEAVTGVAVELTERVPLAERPGGGEGA